MMKTGAILFSCIVDILILSLGYELQLGILVYVSLLGFFFIVLFNTDEYLLPILLFFLPWDNVMKLAPDSYTAFTLCLPFILMIFMFRNRFGAKMIDSQLLLVVLVFTIVTLSTKFFLHFGINGSYIQFVFLMVFIPMYVKIYLEKINFSSCMMFLGAGAVSAGAISKILMNNSHMQEFIIFEDWKAVGLLRLSGFYGDSNFYSLHFLITIAGGLVILSKSKGIGKQLSIMAGIGILAYYGMMSVSKMFLLCLILVVLLWFSGFIVGEEKGSKKIGIIAVFFIAIIISIATNVFQEQINYYMVRLGMVVDTETFTTGRSDLWSDYGSYILSKVSVLFFGLGYTDIQLPFFGNDTHNIIIQSLYQVGLIGLIILGLWAKKFMKYRENYKNLTLEYRLYSLAVLTGFFLPWLSLDLLYFNEFFYMLALFLVFKKYLNRGGVQFD